MNIITISREFGSGGRELGKRIADYLGYDYYDSEIISAVAQKSGMNAGFVERALSNHGWREYPITYRNTIASPIYVQNGMVNLLLEQKKVIEEIVKRMEQYADDRTAYAEKCYISHSACYEDARAVADMIEATFPELEGKVLINYVGTTIGSHTGPGTVALFFWGDKRIG